MWLLNFLLDNVSRVFSLVDWYYNKIINAAFNALVWAINEGWAAYNRAVSYANYIVSLARNFSISLFNALQKTAYDLWNSAKAYATVLFDIGKVLLNLAIAGLRNFIINWVNSVQASLINFVNGTSAFLQALFRGAIELAVLPFLWIVDNRQKILDILVVLKPENLAKLTEFFRTGFQTLTIITSNPFGWFIAYLQQTLLSLLGWSLAYALGTIKLELPPWPDWLSDGYGGDTVPGLPSPIPVGALIAPLSSLSISGNVYGPGHPGVDLGCAGRDPVFAMHSGTVEQSIFSTVGYGWTVTLRNPTFWTRYAHLHGPGPFSGTQVTAGEQIGECDDSGNSTGNHLHLEIKKNGNFVNPIPILGLS